MRRSIVLLAVVGVLLIATTAMATPYDGENWLLAYKTYFGYTGHVNWVNSLNQATLQNVGAGVITVYAQEYTPNTSIVNWAGDIKVFCVDNVTLSQTGDWYTRLVGLMPSSNVPQMTVAGWDNKVWLIGRYAQEALTDQQKSCGLQLAIWEAVTDTGVGFSLDPTLNAGRFSVVDGFDPLAIQYANQYLASIGSNKPTQGQLDRDVCFMDGQNLNVVPEIPTALLAPMGLAALGFLRRKLA